MKDYIFYFPNGNVGKVLRDFKRKQAKTKEKKKKRSESGPQNEVFRYALAA